jgi:hypothetical protein
MLFLTKDGNKLVAENMIPFEEINENMDNWVKYSLLALHQD